MQSLESRALDDWLYVLPLRTDIEPEIVPVLVKDIEDNPENFTLFIESIAPLIDFTRISSLSVVLQLSMLTDPHPSVATIAAAAAAFLPTLCENPACLDETYNFPRLVYDGYDFFIYEPDLSYQWFANLVRASSGSPAVLVWFVAILEMMVDTASSGKVANLAPAIGAIRTFVSAEPIRAQFVNHPNFSDLIVRLFSRSAMPSDSFEGGRVWLGADYSELTHSMITDLDRFLEPYVAGLAGIMDQLLAPNTFPKMVECIPQWLTRIEMISKSGFMFTPAQSSRGAEAFALNFEAVMIKLANAARDRVELIDPLVPHYAASLTPFAAEQGTLAEVDPEDEAEWQSLLSSAAGAPNRLSRIFFLAAYAVECCTSSLVRLRQQIANRASQYTAAQATAEPEMRPLLQQAVRALHVNELSLTAHLLRTRKVEDFLSFTVLALRFMVHVGRIVDGALPEKPTPAFAHLPEYLHGAVATGLSVLPLWQVREAGDLLRHFALLFANARYVKSPVVKAKVIGFFSAVAKDAQTRHLVCGLPRIIDLVFPRLLEFYAAIQVTGTNATNFDRFQYRLISSDLLIAWLGIPDVQRFFLAQATGKVYTDFVFYLVDDSLTFADQSITQLKAIHAAAHEGGPGDAAEGAEVLAEIDAARTNLAHWARAVDKALQLMVCIAAFAAPVFHEPVVLDSLAKLLLCYMDLFANHGEWLAPQTLRGVDLDPHALLVSLMRIAGAVGEDTTIVDRLVENTMFPPAPLSERLLEIARQRGVDGDVARRFEAFAAAVTERTRIMGEAAVDTADAPDEFFDALTYELMKDPVRLPSGNVMEREAVRKMLLTRPVDPWTTKPLTLEECVPDAELKARIDEYLAAKRAAKARGAE